MNKIDSPQTLKFIKVWETSETTDVVAQKMKLSKAQCIAKAIYLRKKGVKLKFFPRGPQPSASKAVVKDLNKMIRDLRKSQSPSSRGQDDS